MLRVVDIYEQNQEEKDTIFIHLENGKKDECDPSITILWEGWLKDIPDEFMQCKVKSTGQSLSDLEKGIVGFYIEIIKNEEIDLFYKSEKSRIEMLNREFFQNVELSERENKVLTWLCGLDDWTIDAFVEVFRKIRG